MLLGAPAAPRATSPLAPCAELQRRETTRRCTAPRLRGQDSGLRTDTPRTGQGHGVGHHTPEPHRPPAPPQAPPWPDPVTAATPPAPSDHTGIVTAAPSDRTGIVTTAVQTSPSRTRRGTRLPPARHGALTSSASPRSLCRRSPAPRCARSCSARCNTQHRDMGLAPSTGDPAPPEPTWDM